MKKEIDEKFDALQILESKPDYEAGQYYWVRYRLAVPEIMRVSQKANYIDLEFRTFDDCSYELDSSDISVLKKVKGFCDE